MARCFFELNLQALAKQAGKTRLLNTIRSETLENAQDTVNFLYDHKPFINSAALGTFLMERDAPAHRSPGTYNVSRIIEEPDKDLAIYFDYEVEAGLDADMAERIKERFTDTLPDKTYPQFYANDIYRFLYACHIKEKHAPMPPWLAPEDVQV